MLILDLPVNYLHRLRSHDTHILVEGGPIDYLVFRPAKDKTGATDEKITLGMDLDASHRLVVAHAWWNLQSSQAAREGWLCFDSRRTESWVHQTPISDWRRKKISSWILLETP